MNTETLKKANIEAIFNIYLYLAHKTPVFNNQTLSVLINSLSSHLKSNSEQWNYRDILRLNILKNAAADNLTLANSTLGNFTLSKSGLTACTFTKPHGSVSVIFKGTGSGEWLDSGEGLSGIPEENTYIAYSKNGKVVSRTVQSDYATTQQVDALNWFNKIAAQNSWNTHTDITVSGHSKGGNKAQFVAVNSDLVDNCFSFDGQGFSPEAVSSFKNQFGSNFEKRKLNIFSFAADNDYVNILGERIMPKENIYYIKSRMGFHPLEAILDTNGKFNPLAEQGELSRYIESVSKELMNMEPHVRQYAALGVMNIFQKYLGGDPPLNNDYVSIEKTVAGLALAVSLLIHRM